MRRSAFAIIVLLVVVNGPAGAQTTGSLMTITPEEYLKLPSAVQALYVADVIDGVSIKSYGKNLKAHDA